MILFSVSGNAASVADTNFKDFYSAINANTSWKTLRPIIIQADRRFVRPYFPELWDKAVAQITTPPAEGEEISAEMMHLLKSASAWYTMYLGFASLNVTTSDMGTQQQGSADGRSNAAPAWAFKHSRNEIMKHADWCIEECLNYIMANQDADWMPEGLKINKLKAEFFPTIQDFQDFWNINNSLRTFLAMVPSINRAANQFVLPILRKDTYNDLLAYSKNVDAEVTHKNDLLRIVRQLLSARATEIAAGSMLLDISNSDSYNITTSAEDSKVHPNERAALAQSLALKAGNMARRSRADMYEFLYDNVDSFPEWKESGAYIQEPVKERTKKGSYFI